MVELQRRLASRVLGVGKSRIWMDPSKVEDIKKAITAADIRRLVKKGIIKVLPEKIKVREKVEKKRKGVGRRKGKKYSIVRRKERWINTVRPLRRMLKELKETNQIDNRTYRYVRKLIKGGMFKSRSHLRIYLEQHGLLKKK
jgi:large subunit ribosomal protein L19e